MQNINSKIVWVTGASSGLGEALVYQFAKENCKIILTSNEGDKLVEVAQKSGLKETDYLILPIELENFNAEDEVKKVIEKFGRLDVLINNAGICQKDYGERTREAIERKIMEINYFAMTKLTKACLPYLKESKGSVAAVGSLNGLVGAPMLTTYAASKFAVKGYFESLRYELEKDGVNVLIIIPGFMKTDITIKSLTGDGSQFGQNSITNEIGITVDKCAVKIVNAIKKRKNWLRMGGLEHLFPVVSFFFPNLHFWVFKKLHKL
jgi:short-subunit dehydrogenase